MLSTQTLKHQFRDWREDLLGLYYQNGAVVSLGLCCVVLLAAQLTSSVGAAAAGLGAMCTSIADTPAGPTRHKPAELMLALVGGTLISLLVGLVSPYHWATAACIGGLSFITALMHGFGRKAIPISLGFLLPMVLTLGTPIPDAHAALWHALMFSFGGFIYILWALPVARLLELRTRRLVLAEALKNFALYQRARVKLFDGNIDLDSGLRQVIQHEDALTEALQTARELLFRQIRGPRELRLAAALVVLLDTFETILSIHNNVQALRQTRLTTPRAHLIELAEHLAESADRQAAALRRGLLAPEEDYRAQLAQTRNAIDAARHLSSASSEEQNAYNNLNSAHNKLKHAIHLMLRMREMLSSDEAARSTLSTINLRAFLQSARYSFGVLRAQLYTRSPILRFALRFTLAMLCGLLLTKLLPYGMHGSWILLTIGVTMRANYALSSQRRIDRVLGDFFGCVFAAALLRLAAIIAPLIGVICVGLTRVYGQRNYQISSTAGCIMGLLLLHYLAPGSGLLISQRLLDSVIGATIAALFSFVLPHWEAHDIPRLVAGLMRATRAYTDQALRFNDNPTRYRLARKGMTDAISVLSGALRRMLIEPESHRLDVAALERLQACANLLASQFASAQVHLRNLHGTQWYASGAAEVFLALARARTLAALNGEIQSTVEKPNAEHASASLQALQRLLIQIEEQASFLPKAAAEAVALPMRA